MRAARDRIAGAVPPTPLLPSEWLSERMEAPVRLKAEHLQRTGSFKVRGALNRMLQLDPEERARGVVTVSAGNHAAAVAWAARRAEVGATVVMPETAPASKVAACRLHGAEVVLRGDVFEALAHCMELHDREGLTLVHPFDDPEILEGQGTVALEILDACPEVELVVVPVGGGGLIGGIAGTLAALAPDVRVIGVEPEGAAAMTRSLSEGRAVRLDAVETVADGLGAPMAGALTYPLVRDYVERVLTLGDPEILDAMAALLEGDRQVVEPAGAAGVAALLTGEVRVAGAVVVVLSGGNIGVPRLLDLLAQRRRPEAD